MGGGPGLAPRMPMMGGGGGGGFGGGLPPFDQQQQHFDPNLAGLGQRQPDFDISFNKRGSDGRGSDQKRPRN